MPIFAGAFATDGSSTITVENAPVLPTNFPWNLGAVTDEQNDNATETTGAFRLAEEFKHQPNLELLLAKLGKPANELGGVMNDLVTQRWFDRASGAQLDNIGSIIGQAREGISDTTYYARRLKARILLNKCQGTLEELIAIMQYLIPTGATLTYANAYPAGFVFMCTDAVFSLSEANEVLKFLSSGRSAGVRGIFIWLASDASRTFTLDGTPAQALDNGRMCGAAFQPS